MIARLRAGRTAQYSQLLLCGMISDMNPQAFESHVKTFYDSPDFKTAAQQAQPFFRVAHDFVFGRLVSDLKLENIVSAL
jgi:hypothetical protein